MRHADQVINNDGIFKEIYYKCKKYTLTSTERKFALYKAVQYIINNDIEGDFVECGVWKGGSTMLIAHTLLRLNATNRKIYLYDTFEGMVEPTKGDRLIGRESIDTQYIWEKRKKWCYASLDKVKKNMISTGYPEKNIIFVKGKVEDTIPSKIPSKISLLRLDTDWYESTKHELIHLYPLLSKNGVLLLDDYGCWAGAKKAADEYFKLNTILLNRIDNAGRIGIKIK